MSIQQFNASSRIERIKSGSVISNEGTGFDVVYRVFIRVSLSKWAWIKDVVVPCGDDLFGTNSEKKRGAVNERCFFQAFWRRNDDRSLRNPLPMLRPDRTELSDGLCWSLDRLPPVLAVLRDTRWWWW